jgi:hypothetical protein
MNSLDSFPTYLQATILYLAKSVSFQNLANKSGITKQAIQKQVEKGTAYLMAASDPKICPSELFEAHATIKEQDKIIKTLRQELILKSGIIKTLELTLEKVRAFYPNLKLTRFAASDKKYFLDLLEKYQKAGGQVGDFCKSIGRSYGTILKWKIAFEKFGINGLVDKITKPANFGNKVPNWIRNELIRLFTSFPNWTDLQYHKYIRHNPTINWYVAIPTIKKIKAISIEKSQEEKDRIIKRWAFVQGTRVWTIDFTTLYKSENYKLSLLTVSDARSRFCFKTALMIDTSTDLVIKHLEELFAKHGKPDFLKADNGPEFRIECREMLAEFTVQLFNSPIYYGQFNGAHERMHRELKTFISNYSGHKNITKLVEEILNWEQQHNYDLHYDYLEGRTAFEVYAYDKDFEPKNVELVKPYEKDGEQRIKFINRDGNPARMTITQIPGD